MPPNVRELVRMLEKTGFTDRGGKGSHRNFVHPEVGRPISISGIGRLTKPSARSRGCASASSAADRSRQVAQTEPHRRSKQCQDNSSPPAHPSRNRSATRAPSFRMIGCSSLERPASTTRP